MKSVVAPGARNELVVPGEKFGVRTHRGTVYRFGAIDENGMRTFAKDNEPPSETLCKVPRLAIDERMILTDSQNEEIISTSAVLSVF